LIGVGYYSEAQKLLEEKLGVRPQYVYFTDDPTWVKLTFSLKEFDLVYSSKNMKDYQEFAVMQKCDHFITANSTFSWWAAYLSTIQKENKITIAPFQWFSCGYETRNSWKDLYIENENFIVLGKKEKKSLNDVFFMGIISCEKYENRRIVQNIQNTKFEYRYFIGRPELSEAQEDSETKTVYLPCPDNYESLSKKVYCMLEWITKKYPNVEYIGKVEDDIKFDMFKYHNYAKYIINNKFDYSGTKVKSKKIGTRHLGKTEDKTLSITPINKPKCDYCVGKAYFLSRKATNIILEDLWKPESETTIYEDQSISHCLKLKNIYPNHITIKNTACRWK
jgi:hypothetical protein